MHTLLLMTSLPTLVACLTRCEGEEEEGGREGGRERDKEGGGREGGEGRGRKGLQRSWGGGEGSGREKGGRRREEEEGEEGGRRRRVREGGKEVEEEEGGGQFHLVFLFSSRVAYYGVFDGHAGSRASTFASENLHKNITTYLPKGKEQLNYC